MGVFDELAKLASGAVPLAVQGVTAYRGAKQEQTAQNASVMQQLEEMAARRQRQAQQDAMDADYKRSQIAKNEADAYATQHPQEKPTHFQTVTLDDGVYAFDPVKGARGEKIGNRPPSQASEPSWTTVQTDGGLVQVNPKTGETRTVVGPGGSALRRQAPAQIAQAVSSNRKQLSVIDEAIRNLEQHPNAVGLKYNVIPDAVAQVLNPSGVDTRAAVSDIGSLQIHDRTGAAMNASESIRLKPFVPGPGDQASAAIKKLKRLRAALQDDTEFLSQTYGIGADAPPAPQPVASQPAPAKPAARNPWRP